MHTLVKRSWTQPADYLKNRGERRRRPLECRFQVCHDPFAHFFKMLNCRQCLHLSSLLSRACLNDASKLSDYWKCFKKVKSMIHRWRIIISSWKPREPLNGLLIWALMDVHITSSVTLDDRRSLKKKENQSQLVLWILKLTLNKWFMRVLMARLILLKRQMK